MLRASQTTDRALKVRCKGTESMGLRRCHFAVMSAGALLVASAWPAARLAAQPPWIGIAPVTNPSQYELSPSIQIEDVDESNVKPQLARIRAYLADKKWDEAVEALR